MKKTPNFQGTDIDNGMPMSAPKDPQANARWRHKIGRGVAVTNAVRKVREELTKKK